MLTYEPGDTLLHRLDPRSKLAGQVGFAIAVFGTTLLPWLGVLTTLALVILVLAGLSPLRVLWSYRYILLFLATAPIIAGLQLTAPWFDTGDAAVSLVAVYQVLLVLLVSGVYVYSTPVRETRAAIQRHAPGRLGQLLGVGVALVVRLFPLVLADVRDARTALAARGGANRPLTERTWRLALLSVRRAFLRADTLSLALRARCFAWNPTLPHLQLSPVDYLVILFALVLAGSSMLLRFGT